MERIVTVRHKLGRREALRRIQEHIKRIEANEREQEELWGFAFASFRHGKWRDGKAEISILNLFFKTEGALRVEEDIVVLSLHFPGTSLTLKFLPGNISGKVDRMEELLQNMLEGLLSDEK